MDECLFNILAASQQNQHNGFATSMDPDQPAHLRSLIRTYAVRLQTHYVGFVMAWLIS
jgi:hypothetical protein